LEQTLASPRFDVKGHDPMSEQPMLLASSLNNYLEFIVLKGRAWGQRSHPGKPDRWATQPDHYPTMDLEVTQKSSSTKD